MSRETLKTWESFSFNSDHNAVLFVTPQYITNLSSPNVFVGENTRIDTITKIFKALGVGVLFTESKNLDWKMIQFFHPPLALAVVRFDGDQTGLARKKRQMVEGRWTLIVLEEPYNSIITSPLQERVNAIKGHWIPYKINPSWLKWNEHTDVMPLRFVLADRTPPTTKDEKRGKMAEIIRYFALHIPDNSTEALGDIDRWKQL